MSNVLRNSLFGILAVGAFGTANAATVILNNGAPYDYVVHNDNAGSGNSLALTTKQVASLVTYSSSDMLDAGAGNGVASVTGIGKAGFSNILVDPDLNFDVIQFKLEGPNGQDAGTNFDILVTFVGGGTQIFLDQLLPSNSKFDILAGAGEMISSVAFSDLRTDAGALVNFTALKQVSFDAATGSVPEPSSWAMILVGFGAIGLASRRRSAARTQAI